MSFSRTKRSERKRGGNRVNQERAAIEVESKAKKKKKGVMCNKPGNEGISGGESEQLCQMKLILS